MVRRLVAQRLMRSLGVVEPEVLRQADRQLGHVGVALQVHILILHLRHKRSTKMLSKRPPAPVHADRHVFALEHAGEHIAGELRTLVAVEHLRPAVVAQSYAG